MTRALLQREGVDGPDGLLRKYRHFVWRIAWRFVRDADDAEDVTQEVLLRLHRHLDGLRPETRLPAWLTRVTTNAALNFSRGEARRRRLWQRVRALAPTVAAPPVGSPLAREIVAAIAALPKGQRAVVTLRLLEERTFREIAEIFAVSQGTVKVQFARGLRALRESLAGRRDAPATRNTS